MKNKKLFAILTLVAFMLTMMPVMAFATTSADVYAWVEDGSAKANGTDKVIAYVDFDKLGADEALYVYTAKAGQAYDAVQMTLADNGWDGSNGFCFTDKSKGENRKIEITATKPAELTLKVVLVKAVADADPTGLTMAQVNKGTHDEFDFFAVDVEDSAIKFKSTQPATDATFDVDVIAYDNGNVVGDETDVLAANGGVAYFKVTATLENAAGDAVKNKEVTIETNKAGVAVSEDVLETNNRGVVKFNVYATKNGTYEITLTADGAEDKVIELSFGTAAIGSVKVVAQPQGNTALGELVRVNLNVTDTNGNALDAASLDKLKGARDIQFVAVPEDSDIEKGTILKGNQAVEGDYAWFDKNKYNGLQFRAKVDEPGNYTVKLYNGNTGAGVEYIYFSVAKFDKPVSATIAYDNATYMLDAKVEAPSVTVYDANGTSRTAKNPAFSYTGVGVVDFNKADGTFKISDDDKYLGQQIVVNVVAEKMFATTTLNIADVPAYLQFADATAAVGTEATVNVKSLDLKGNVAALGDQYRIADVSYVVTSKPEGAIVGVDVANLQNLADFKTVGSENIKIASNKEGTVTVNVVVEAQKVDAQGAVGETVFLTGIANVNFGGKVTTVSSSATMIIGSNVFVANGGVLTAPVAPAIVDGRTYLPIRALSQALGCEVGYADGVVTITYGTTVVTMTIGSNVMTVGAETVQIDAAPYVVDGTTMVPLRAAATALGYDIDVTYNVDGTVATVTVYKK